MVVVCGVYDSSVYACGCEVSECSGCASWVDFYGDG